MIAKVFWTLGAVGGCLFLLALAAVARATSWGYLVEFLTS